jgi:predicted DNA binding CopG/RHH family protein
MKKGRKSSPADPLAEDLTGYLSTLNFKRAKVEMAPKDTTVTLRVPSQLIVTAKKVAKKHGVKYQTMMRQAIVEYVAKAA